VLGFQAWERIRLSMSGATRAALKQLEECEEARELLGEPIDTAWWGWSHGRIRVPRSSQTWSATSGTVDWSMPVAGSNARGVLHFQGKKAGDVPPMCPSSGDENGTRWGETGRGGMTNPRRIKAIAGNSASCLRFPIALPTGSSPVLLAIESLAILRGCWAFLRPLMP
jgi:hypothetical protein